MPTATEPIIFKTVDYDSLLAFYKSTYNISQSQIDDYIAAANRYNINDLQAVEELLGQRISFNKTADGAYQLTGWDTPIEEVTTSIADSNVSTVKRGNFRQIFNRAKDDLTGKLNISRFPKSGSLGEKAGYFLGSAGSAWCAVSTGIFLGKTIDSVLYNANPDFWDSHNMSSLNPETWNNITNGYDGPGAGLFNFILGLDPDTGNSQMYINEDALAYMAWYMKNEGAFNDGGISTPYDTSGMVIGDTYPATFITGTVGSLYTALGVPYGTAYHFMDRIDYPAIMGVGSSGPCVLFDDSGVTLETPNEIQIVSGSNPYYITSGATIKTSSGKFIFALEPFRSGNDAYYPANTGQRSMSRVLTSRNPYGTYAPLIGSIEQPVDGIGDQTGAVIPDTSTWTDFDSVKNSLREQYPDIYNNALEWDNVQPDGTNPILRYIPVPMPNIGGQLNSQPTSGTQTQSSTIINPQTTPLSIVQAVTDALQNANPETKPKTEPQTETETQPVTPPTNPSPIGSGTTPTPAPATGSASALWSVYHPTQEQVDQFGGWLWTDNIITQIQQVLQNPMDGIITLHKVFVQPVDSSSGTIVVGRLDSGVPSATVTQQYVYVDCGSINCFEYYGNIFDYAPYTRVSLYLPFIGIVPLNVDDVMRSTINVTYGCDVFTGACLAMVKIKRDGNTANLYQYSGVCSVEYPLTGGIHSGLINGLLGIAGGVAGIASGGVAAGGAAVVSGLASSAHTSNAQSSSFSGNAGAMGIKKPYLIIERPLTKVADNFTSLQGYPTNYRTKLGNCSGHVVVSDVHVSGINATDTELADIESLLHSGIII